MFLSDTRNVLSNIYNQVYSIFDTYAELEMNVIVLHAIPFLEFRIRSCVALGWKAPS